MKEKTKWFLLSLLALLVFGFWITFDYKVSELTYKAKVEQGPRY